MTAMHGLQPWRTAPSCRRSRARPRPLDGIEPGHNKTIELTIGDPKEAMPGFVRDQ